MDFHVTGQGHFNSQGYHKHGWQEGAGFRTDFATASNGDFFRSSSEDFMQTGGFLGQNLSWGSKTAWEQGFQA